MSSAGKEQSLWEQIQKGQKSALEELFRLYYTPLVRFAYQKVQSSDVAEDLVQEVFFKLWNQRDSIRITTSLKSYLYTATKNLSLNELQKTKRHAELNQVYSEQQEQYVPGMSEEDAAIWDQRIQEAVSTLPTRCQEVFRLSRFEGLTYQEIADSLNISPKTVENQMGKALSVLREKLAHFLELCGPILLLMSLFWE
jgi:RNA polymerase sigma-70 factor (ECF subfamily)